MGLYSMQVSEIAPLPGLLRLDNVDNRNVLNAVPETARTVQIQMSAAVELDTHAFSHIGNVRADNQDSVRVGAVQDKTEQAFQVFAIADGMGGYQHGGVASLLAIDTFIQTLSAMPENLQSSRIESAMRRAVQDANLLIYQESMRRQAKMGTTLTAACLIGSEIAVAHIGDSRAYLIRDGQASCLTRDHTAVGELVRARVITPDKVRKHAQRSVLNRCLGVALIVQPDVSRVTLQTGDMLLFCSDGLWASLEDNQIAALADPGQPAETIAERLVNAALEAGSDDNVSALAVCVRHAPDNAATGDSSKRSRLPGVLRGLLRA